MAQFVYQGINRDGNKVNGTLDVPNEGELRMALRSLGIRPTRISRGGSVQAKVFTGFGNASSGSQGSVPIKILILFTRQMQLLISSGIPLVQALEMLGEQTSHNGMKSVVTSIRERVSSGSFLWESMAAFPNTFPKLYVALTRAGESSGAMDSVLRRLGKYLEDEDRLKRMVKSAMMYPVIVLSIGFGVVFLMLKFVIPKFEEMLKQSNQELPAVTQFVINLSHWVSDNFLFLIGGIGAGIYLFKRFLGTPEGRAMKDQFVYRMPLFGMLAQKSGVARFCRTLHTLITAGVPLIDAIDICKAVADNYVIENAVGKIRGEVESGKNLGETLLRLNEFPKMAAQMVSVGENSGNLDKSLEKVADFYESDVEVLVGGMTKLIEPFILVFLGGLIGGLMIAMYMPIFQLAGGAN